MSWFRDPVITLSRFLLLFLLLVLIKIFHKLWWTPIRIQHMLALQGIKGPSYRLIHGSTKEIMSMKKETMGRPMNLSHDILPEVQPHIHSWTKIYGKNFLQWYGSQAQLVIGEPELCKEILNNKHRAYSKKGASSLCKETIRRWPCIKGR
ncbi:hypothetical protein PRUPE_1G291600 [Prunus persica]|uniref:Cytochrome P450 n=1 Tax=Prunus persica TaxID=3760 RepID=A0A251R5W1_PRUPE|nr:hypothetical protein PRUPE_1G291600 [Prunus persica]